MTPALMPSLLRSTLLLFAGTVLLSVLGCHKAPRASTPAVAPVASDTADHPTAPDFTRPTLEGDTLRLSEERGKVVVLNFWATWCGPCRHEIPEFIELQDELGEDDLRIVGVSLDEEGFEAVEPFAEEMEINYPLVIGTDQIARAYGGIPAIPTTFILDQEGYVRHHVMGLATRDNLLPVLRDLLDE